MVKQQQQVMKSKEEAMIKEHEKIDAYKTMDKYE